jgi:hypothetical protein
MQWNNYDKDAIPIQSVSIYKLYSRIKTPWTIKFHLKLHDHQNDKPLQLYQEWLLQKKNINFWHNRKGIME